MRQPAINPAAALWSLIAALLDDRLREFVLEMLLASLTAQAPICVAMERVWDRGDKPPASRTGSDAGSRAGGVQGGVGNMPAARAGRLSLSRDAGRAG
jgi:hypothetical protein